jgi:2-polyprenyl-3-methyl-5-hydroxy-6-metoxy-1,4-benzoquinol methylase
MNHDKQIFFNEIADQFDSIMNKYDVNKRLKIVFDVLLGEIRGKKLLDAGCGTGLFSKRAVDLGAKVTSLDIGKKLLDETGKKTMSQKIVADICNIPFVTESFDIVISSECIEHTLNPENAVNEMCRVLKKKGILVITTPNRTWHFAVTIANLLKLRPYEGYENWLGWFKLKKLLKAKDIEILDMFGFHIVPFIFPQLDKLIDYFDRFGNLLGFAMLNIAVKGIKKTA